VFDNNIVELSITSDEGIERININKIKVYHRNLPTNVIIVAIYTRPCGKIGNRHRKKTKLNLPFKLYTKPKKLSWINPKVEKHLMNRILSGLEGKIQEDAYKEFLKM
jgi:hypothetical protein